MQGNKLLKSLKAYGFKKVHAIPLDAVQVRRAFEEKKKGIRGCIVVKGPDTIPILGTGYKAKHLGEYEGEHYYIVWKGKYKKEDYVEEPELW